MPRPSNWNSPTAALRVPAHAVGAVLALAKQLDQGFVQNDLPTAEPYLLTDGENRYLIAPPNAPAEVWQQADLLIAQLTAGLSEDEQFLLLAQLASQWGRPISLP